MTKFKGALLENKIRVKGPFSLPQLGGFHNVGTVEFSNFYGVSDCSGWFILPFLDNFYCNYHVFTLS